MINYKNMQYNIYAIVVTYNGTKWIDKCFGSLLNSTIPLNIIAIDNASKDNTPSIIKAKFPKVEVIETGSNLGFGKANNIGLKKIIDKNIDFVFLLNQDAWIEPDTVKNLVAISEKNSKYGIISPIHLNGQGDAIDQNFQSYLNNNNTPEFYSDLFLGKTKKFYISKYANAAAWLISKKCINTIGGFDPVFNHYGEDDDYLNRLHLSGLKLVIVTDSIIFHDRSQKKQINKNITKNQIYTLALLKAKNYKKIKKHFIWRKIIDNYFSLYFVYLGKNNTLRNNIKINLLALKLVKKVSNKIKIDL